MAFQRQSMEQLLDKMIGWARGVSTKITDFRVGSKVRTYYEAVALIVEEQQDRVYRNNRQLIEDNIYAIVGFDKIPATYASGLVTFSRTSPANQAYFIPVGTVVLSQATAYSAPMKYRTLQDTIIPMGNTSVDVAVTCTVPGVVGNIGAGTLTGFAAKPFGVDNVTNALAFSNGQDEESNDAQKARFQLFVDSQARGVLQSIEYGARISMVVDGATGVVTERVMQAKATEDLVNKKCQVDLYVWNGVGAASQALIDVVNKMQTGYYDPITSAPVYGYKPAGVLVNVYSAPVQYVTIQLVITPEVWSTLDLLKPKLEAEIDRFFGALKLGDTIVRSALEANLKYIEGVYDVRLSFSTDNGVTFSMNNVTATTTTISLPKKPIVYA